MYEIRMTKTFRKDAERCRKRGYDMELLKTAIRLLESDGKLPATYRPHKLSAQYDGCWECHLKPDWLLIWEQNDTELVLLFTGTGTHSDLFWFTLPNFITHKILPPHTPCGGSIIFYRGGSPLDPWCLSMVLDIGCRQIPARYLSLWQVQSNKQWFSPKTLAKINILLYLCTRNI